MLIEEPVTTDFSVVSRVFDAIERGDMVTLRHCYAPGALTWHNNDEVDQDVDAVVAVLTALCAVSTSRIYEDVRRTIVGSQVFQQHTLTATLLSGRRMRVPAMMRIEVDSEGLVARIEEYFDSRELAVLAEEMLS